VSALQLATETPSTDLAAFSIRALHISQFPYTLKLSVLFAAKTAIAPNIKRATIPKTLVFIIFIVLMIEIVLRSSDPKNTPKILYRWRYLLFNSKVPEVPEKEMKIISFSVIN
jgi:hypothetical protein